MLPVEIAPGLLRWTASHPEWKPSSGPAGNPDEWDQMVGSVLYELPELVVLVDPLLPIEDRSAFLEWLDRRVGSRPVSILTTIRWHRRDRAELAERYKPNSAKAWNAIPAEVSPRPLRGAGETPYWLPGPRALVFGDAVLGDDGGGLRVCPEGWLAQVRVDRRGLGRLLRGLLELPIERVLVSHGEPVLRDGRAALARAIAQAGGEQVN